MFNAGFGRFECEAFDRVTGRRPVMLQPCLVQISNDAYILRNLPFCCDYLDQPRRLPSTSVL